MSSQQQSPTPPLEDVGVDFETYYDKEYNLEKMTTAEYVMDPRFEIIGVSIKRAGQPAEWISGTIQEVHRRLSDIDWSRVRVVAHNARFEAAILEWRLGLQPQSYLCTMVGSRPHFVPYAGGQSLEAIARYLKLPPKGTYVHEVSGLHRDDFGRDQILDYAAYCCNDSELGVSVSQALLQILPEEEQQVIDATIKKYVRPTLLLAKNPLVARLKEIEDEKANRLAELSSKYGIGLAEIRSRPKFAELLNRALLPSGQVVPTKPTKRKDGSWNETFAFAKDDVQFKQLLGHPSPAVRDLVSAKLYFSSTLEESRIRKLLSLADLFGGRLTVPLVYYGAHTGRFSGDDGINLQNLPRVDVDETAEGHRKIRKGHLRFAITAQPGYSIVAADLSNIEARIVATLAGQLDLVDGFRSGADIYSTFASRIYGYAVNKKDHKRERFVGKTCILGLGYGMGWKKFHLKMAQEGIIMPESEAKRIVFLYRETYGNIPKLWRSLDYAAQTFLVDPKAVYPWRDMIFAHERIILPNGMPIIYPGITRKADGGIGFRNRHASSLLTGDGKVPDNELNNVWGGAFLENIAQALARIILTRAELKLARMGIVAALQVHDELVFHIPTVLVERVEKVIASVMTEVVPWLSELPVAVEIAHGPTYGDCK